MGSLDYKKYQKILQIKSGNKLVQKSLKTSKRTFTGCLNCKRKKKKCDETKPICKSCSKRDLECTWPCLDKLHSKTTRCKNQAIQEKGDEISLVRTVEKHPDSIGGGINDRNGKTQPGISFNFNLDSFSSWIPGVSLSKEDAQFYHTFVVRLVPSLPQPLTNFHISNNDIYIPLAAMSETGREVIIAMGAVIMAFDNDFYSEVARRKYLRAIGSFLKRLKDGNFDGTEDWLFMEVQLLQTLCLRDKLQGFNATRCAQHLLVAKKIIEKRFLKLIKEDEHELVFYLQLLQNGERDFLKKISHLIQFSPIDGVLIENFIFNYAITILLCHKDQLEALVPDPFNFFTRFNIPDSCEVDGSKEIVDAYFFAFELASKCSWICRLKLPLDDENQGRCSSLLLRASFELSKTEKSHDLLTNDSKRRHLTIIELVLRTSIILLKKILDPIGIRATGFYDEINHLIEIIQRPYNQNLVLPCWSLLIAGSASSTALQRQFFKSELEVLVHSLSSNTVLLILNFLEAIWNSDFCDNAFEFIFYTEAMNLICT
ncbi:uncharacterized protein PRCAT00001382001 [Priceomyces carsonii]|uniref:uncharacterized protein n=1 Tax=Priceomyces carsonii TaxID=28549 RepID=UPI002ED830A2|nr:unnamed protein product [Priceomyces carsonii]